MSDENTVYIVSACRTPIGSFCGAFRDTPAHELGAAVITELLQRGKVDPESISEIILGQSLTAGQGQNPARQASLKANIPVSVPAYGISMLCGSGLKAVHVGYQSIKAKESSIVVAGGQECMSMANHCAFIRSGVKLGTASFQDTIFVDGLVDAFCNIHMGNTAEYLSKEYGVTREQQDQFACNSQHKVEEALLKGHFKSEIVPVTVGRDKIVVDTDEYPKPNVTMEGLAKLRPAFVKNIGNANKPSNNYSFLGTVTAGNASGVNDGAAGLLLCASEVCKQKGLEPLAKIVAFGQSGLEPIEMGLGPIETVKVVLKKANWTLDEVDLFELNEAFAVQSILVNDKLQIPADKVNVAGGAIALGHPIGCSGARILVTLIYNLKRLNKKKGIASLCVGGGMGIGIAIELC